MSLMKCIIALLVSVFFATSTASAQFVNRYGQNFNGQNAIIGEPLYNLSTSYGRQRFNLARTREYVQRVSVPIYARHQGEPAWVASWQYLQKKMEDGTLIVPLQSESGTWLGKDNDGKGVPEPVYVSGYINPETGGYVRSYHRCLPYWDEDN